MEKMALLHKFLRPPGLGLYTVSTGSGLASGLLKKIYRSDAQSIVQKKWEAHLKKIKKAKIAFIGIPSDIGAGYKRGSNFAPLELRKILYKNATFKRWIKKETVIDIGDIICVPQLLHDELLSNHQHGKIQESLHNVAENFTQKYLGMDYHLPVSPLSLLEATADILFDLNADIKLMALGGDHSISWPLVQSTVKRHGKNFSILHFDAHTDLLKTRLGIDHCFGTWAYHANDLIGRKQKLVQVGIRATAKSKAHWEKTLGVKQFWAKDIRQNPKKAIRDILKHLYSLNLKNIYISNDIDGTGSEFAACTGTAEPKGYSPKFANELIHQVAQAFNVIGSDLNEVAPILHLNKRGEPAKSLKVAGSYFLSMTAAMLK